MDLFEDMNMSFPVKAMTQRQELKVCLLFFRHISLVNRLQGLTGIIDKISLAQKNDRFAMGGGWFGGSTGTNTALNGFRNVTNNKKGRYNNSKPKNKVTLFQNNLTAKNNI